MGPSAGEPLRPEAGEVALGGTGDSDTDADGSTHARTEAQAWPSLARRRMDWERKQEGSSGAGEAGGHRGPTAQRRPHGQAPTLHGGLPYSGRPPGP